ncbi:diaminopimelate decarboxylase [Pseudogemmatithrix spongiicola]|nr:diaminopimelate decarboxylase [Gemmatimonadaceae bacterium 'strain 318']
MAQGFGRRDGELYAADVPLRLLAEAVGTPAYVYCAETMRERVRRLDDALAGIPHRVHYAAKANSSGGVLRTLRDAGVGVDVVSGGELFKAIRAGFRPQTDIVFGGVGKTLREIGEAIAVGVKLLNVESEAELHLASEMAVELKTTAAVGIRVNPDVEVETAHEYIATGDKEHKFGVPLDDAERVARVAMALPGLALQGLHMHVGSQLYSYAAYREGAEKLVALAKTLRAAGAPIRYLDLGGGLPVPYAPNEGEPDLAAYGAVMREAVAALGDVELLVEHGRYLVAASAVLVTEVLYRKHNGGVDFVVCDAGMTELIRPSHYDAYHHVEPVGAVTGQVTADVVGPVCESGDFLAVARTLPDVQPGDLLAIHTVGAYGSAMASRYNARGFAAEVLVDGNRWAVVTQPEDYTDLVRQDVESPQWQET